MGKEAKCVSLVGTVAFSCVWAGPWLVNTRNKMFFLNFDPFTHPIFFFHRKMSLQYEENSLNGLIYIYFSFGATTLVLSNPMVLEGGQTNRFSSVYLCVSQKMCREAATVCVPRTGLAARYSRIKEFLLAMSQAPNAQISPREDKGCAVHTCSCG